MTPLEQLYRALKPIKISELAKTHVLYNQFYKKEFTGLQKMEQIRKLSGTTNTTRAIRDYKLTISDKAALQEASINDLVRSLMAKYSCKNNIDPFTLETIKALQHQKHPLITLNQWCFKLDSLLTYVQTTMKENRVPRNPFDRKQFLETEIAKLRRKTGARLNFNIPTLNPSIYLAKDIIHAKGRPFYTLFIMVRHGMIGVNTIQYPREWHFAQQTYHEIHPILFKGKETDAVLLFIGYIPADLIESHMVIDKIEQLFKQRRLLINHQPPLKCCTIPFETSLQVASQFKQDSVKWHQFVLLFEE